MLRFLDDKILGLAVFIDKMTNARDPNGLTLFTSNVTLSVNVNREGKKFATQHL